MAGIKGMIQGTCPKCEKGKIFETRGNILLGKVPRMHAQCPSCGYVFEKEPGYFLGAMYVSYALTVAEMIALFVLFFAFLPLWLFFIVLAGVIVLLSFFNFRVSRIVWIHMFPR